MAETGRHKRANLRGLHDVYEKQNTAQEGVGRWIVPWSLANIFSCLRIDIPGLRRRQKLVVCTKPDAASVNVPSRESVSAEARPPPPDLLDRVLLMIRGCN